MKSRLSQVTAAFRARKGQTMTEYALILATVAAVLISVYASLAAMLTAFFAAIIGTPA